MPTSAGPIERAGLTEVPVMLMPTRWMTTSVSPDGETGEAGRRDRVGDAKNADQKEERPHHFEHEGRDEIIFAKIPRAPAVLAEPPGPPLSFTGQNEIEHHGGDDRAKT